MHGPYPQTEPNRRAALGLAVRRATILEGQRWGVSGVLLGSLLFWLYLQVLVPLARQWWTDDNYSHGFLIPLLSAYFVWERRESLAKLPVRSSPFGLALLAGGIGALLLGNVSAELFTTRVSLLVVLAGLVLYLFGREYLRMLAFPILYLLFMIPLPAIVFNAIAFPLQLFAARTATAVLQFLQIPVFREGNLITLANIALEVAEACSGIRSLITLLALALTYAYFTQRRPWRRIVLVLSTVPIAIAANVSRIAGTGILAHLYGSRAAQGFFHEFSGWLIFLVAAVLLAAEGFLLSKLFPQRGPAHTKLDQAGLEADPTNRQESQARALPSWRRVGSAAVVLVAGILSLMTLSHGEAVPVRQRLEDFPVQLGQWRGIGEALPPSILDVLKVTDYIMRLYSRPQSPPVWLYVGYYGSQRQGQTIHSPQQCLPGSGWSILSREYLTVTLPGRLDPVTINRVLIGKGQDRQIVFYWYQERGRVIASEFAAKAYLVVDAVTRNRTDGALVRISATVRGSEEEAVEQLLDFVRLIFPHLMEFLPS